MLTVLMRRIDVLQGLEIYTVKMLWRDGFYLEVFDCYSELMSEMKEYGI